ncbi:MAG: ankyrin repeat domain-containing protein, partial [Gemmatimonadota bacterium]|nr:ankyrin repeat domain-containing protein [Gemmatimonadota bacterium]
MPSAVRGRGKTVAAALTAVVLLSAAAPGRVAYSAKAAVAATTESPVADAAMRGDSAKVRTLLRQGVDANAAQSDGMTALHWASARGDAGQVHVLVVAGARLEATTR